MSKVISPLIRNIFNSSMALENRGFIDGARFENLCQFGGKLRNKLSTMRKTKKFTAPDEGDGST